MPNADRFLGRAQVYAAARPTYPAALRAWLAELGLLSTVADIGAGTGLFTRLLLEGGAQVTAVEPNPEMRQQLAASLAEALASGQLRVQGGTSEATGLADASVKLVTAAQAAHWFDPAPTLQEFRRILRPGGRVLLLWNDWRGSPDPFNVAYGETITRFYQDGDDPVHINRVPENEIPAFMPGGYQKQVFENPVLLSRERLHALAGSVSYLPHPQHPSFQEMTRALNELFDLHQHNHHQGHQQGHQHSEFVTLQYRTHAFLGLV